MNITHRTFILFLICSTFVSYRSVNARLDAFDEIFDDAMSMMVNNWRANLQELHHWTGQQLSKIPFTVTTTDSALVLSVKMREAEVSNAKDTPDQTSEKETPKAENINIESSGDCATIKTPLGNISIVSQNISAQSTQAKIAFTVAQKKKVKDEHQFMITKSISNSKEFVNIRGKLNFEKLTAQQNKDTQTIDISIPIEAKETVIKTIELPLK